MSLDERLEALGWAYCGVTRHKIYRHPECARKLTVPCSPSDRRNEKNVLSRAKRYLTLYPRVGTLSP